MQLLNAAVLERFIRKHTDAGPWIANWRVTVEQAAWTSIDDVRKIYPSADGVKIRPQVVVTVFNVKGNEYRLITSIAYARQVVYVLDAMSHAEYDKEKWKKRLSSTTRKLSSKAADDYLELVRQFPLRAIRSERELKAAHEVLKPLFLHNENTLTPGESDYLGTLSVLVHDYEKQHYPRSTDKRTPLQRLKFLMDESHMKPSDLERLLGASQPLVSLMLNGKRELSKTSIRKLAEHFKLEPSYFL